MEVPILAIVRELECLRLVICVEARKLPTPFGTVHAALASGSACHATKTLSLTTDYFCLLV